MLWTLRKLRTGDVSTRIRAVQALERRKSPRSTVALISALRDPHGDVRFEAAQALGARGWVPAGDAERALLAVARRDWRNATGADAIEPLLTAVRDVSWKGKRYFESESAKALEALGRIPDPRAVELLLQGLTDPTLRETAIEGLGAAGDRRAVSTLMPLLSDSSSYTRRITAWALGQLGDPSVAGALLHQGSTDGDPEVKEAAMAAATRILGAAAADELLASVRGSDRSTRIAALRTLATIHGSAADEAISEMLDDTDYQVRRAAIQVLGQLKGPFVELAAVLRQLPMIQVSEAGTAISAEVVLSRIKAATAKPIWFEISEDVPSGVYIKDLDQTGHPVLAGVARCGPDAYLWEPSLSWTFFLSDVEAALLCGIEGHRDWQAEYSQAADDTGLRPPGSAHDLIGPLAKRFGRSTVRAALAKLAALELSELQKRLRHPGYLFDVHETIKELSAYFC